MVKFKALTLIELTVAISITILLIALSIPLFRREGGENVAAKEAELVASYIESARSMAQHPESENAQAYRVRLNSDPSNKIINTVRLEKDQGESVIETKTLDNNLILSKSFVEQFAPIDFYVFSGEFKSQNPEYITVKLSTNPNKSKVVEVVKPGVVNVK